MSTITERMLIVLVTSMIVCRTYAKDSCPDLPQCFCSKDKTSVNCEGKHMTSIPSNLPTETKKLYLDYNDITVLKKTDFNLLSSLEKLSIKNNKVYDIESFTFANLSMLSYIDIQNNKLQSLTKFSFANMRRLRDLYFTNNRIAHIDSTTFSGSRQVTYINLQANALSSIPDIGDMPNLKTIVLTGNSLSEVKFPESYQSSKHLSGLSFSANKINSLSNDSFVYLRNNSLTKLYLSNNVISIVEPGVFSPLAAISSLKLGNNPMDGVALKSAVRSLHGKQMVSLDISNMKLNGMLMKDTFVLLKNTAITTLNMKYNKISSLPDSAFSGLNFLQHLDISSCQIESTSTKSFDGLDKLTVLNLEKNKLSFIPKNLPTTLNNLYLDSNDIVTISGKPFNNLRQLKELRIRYNKLQTLTEDSFAGLSSLTKLSLYSNNIATLPGKLFQSLVRLTSLDLARNNLYTIQNSPGRLSSLGSLVYLNLADNKCRYFQPDFFQDLMSLRYLHLERNLLGDLIARDYGGNMFKGLTKLKQLHLMDNSIFAIPEPIFQNLNSMQFLNLSSNKVKGWGSTLFSTPTELKTLDLSMNLIATINSDNVKDFTAVESLNLTGNPFSCNCDLRWFRDWINKTNILLTGLQTYECNAPPDWAGKLLLSFDRTKINCQHFTLKIIIIACSAVALIVIIMGTIIYFRRWHIKLCWYKLTRGKGRKKCTASDGRGRYGAIEEEGTVYDAYISCADEDKDWARKNLLPGLDKGQLDEDHVFGGDFSLYFEDRDAIPGEPLVGNIFENMSRSRKVIVVLSQNYLEDKMHQFEMDLAIDQMYNRLLEEVIVVHIDKGLPNHKIPRYLWKSMHRHHMIEWSENENAKELFTRTLADRLAVTANAADLGGE